MLAAIKSAFGIRVWPEFSREDVSKHNTAESLWIVAGDKVFDVTNFVGAHPGGPAAIVKRGGGCADCREDYKFHSKGARDQWKQFQIGVLSSDAVGQPIPRGAAPAPELVGRYTPALRFGGSFAAPPTTKLPDPASTASFTEASFAAPVPAAPTAASVNDGEDAQDGGEDVIASGCCTGAEPGSRCATCPNAPRCLRRSVSATADQVPLRR